jgi:hypothetical protein
MYTAGPPKGLAAAYIEFTRSAAGQWLVERLGFFPLPLSDRWDHALRLTLQPLQKAVRSAA